MTLFYGQNLIKCSAGVKTNSTRCIFGNLTYMWCESLWMLVGENFPRLVGKTELYLIAVFLSLCRTKNRTALRQFNLANACEVVHNLSLLPIDLLFVGETLPLTTSTHTIVRANGLLAVLAHLVETNHCSLHKMMLFACNSNINNIARNSIWNKENHIVYAC